MFYECETTNSRREYKSFMKLPASLLNIVSYQANINAEAIHSLLVLCPGDWLSTVLGMSLSLDISAEFTFFSYLVPRGQLFLFLVFYFSLFSSFFSSSLAFSGGCKIFKFLFFLVTCSENLYYLLLTVLINSPLSATFIRTSVAPTSCPRIMLHLSAKAHLNILHIISHFITGWQRKYAKVKFCLTSSLLRWPLFFCLSPRAQRIFLDYSITQREEHKYVRRYLLSDLKTRKTMSK